MVQRIFCPTDLTEQSRLSVTYAFRLAKENSAQLIVFHATSFPSLSCYPCDLEPYYEWEQLASRFKVDQLLSDAESKVKDFVGVRFGAESDGVAWKPRVALGRIAEEIVAAALQEEVDLIVLARRKKGMFARLLSRSVSEAVSKNPPCPLLSIDASQPIRPVRGWRLPVLQGIGQSL
jgi:nucleotide-binding universal stress UspA family protein